MICYLLLFCVRVQIRPGGVNVLILTNSLSNDMKTMNPAVDIASTAFSNAYLNAVVELQNI